MVRVVVAAFSNVIHSLTSVRFNMIFAELGQNIYGHNISVVIDNQPDLTHICPKYLKSCSQSGLGCGYTIYVYEMCEH